MILIQYEGVNMDRKGAFQGTVCKERKSLKIYIPMGVANYIGIMAGDLIDVRIVGHRKERNSGITSGV